MFNQLGLLELTVKIGYKQIKVLDVGGGVPNNYHGDSDTVDFAAYKTDVLGKLVQRCH